MRWRGGLFARPTFLLGGGDLDKEREEYDGDREWRGERDPDNDRGLYKSCLSEARAVGYLRGGEGLRRYGEARDERPSKGLARPRPRRPIPLSPCAGGGERENARRGRTTDTPKTAPSSWASCMCAIAASASAGS